MKKQLFFIISLVSVLSSPVAFSVDIGIGAFLNRTVFEYPNWNTTLTPWLPSFSLPANFKLPVTLLDNLNTFPGGLKPGAYQLAVALTTPNTLNILSFYTTAFKIISLKNELTIGSIGFSHGESATGVTPTNISAGAAFFRVEKKRYSCFT